MNDEMGKGTNTKREEEQASLRLRLLVEKNLKAKFAFHPRHK